MRAPVKRRRYDATKRRDLMSTGQVRRGLEVDDIADVIWAMNAPEFTMPLPPRLRVPARSPSPLRA
jgi:hypothetical protein